MRSRFKDSAFIRSILFAQPYLTFPIFVSVLTGYPPLWLAWLIALVPVALRAWITHRLSYRTPFDIPVAFLTAGIVFGMFLSRDMSMAYQYLHTYLACVFLYYGIVNNRNAGTGYWVGLAGFLIAIVAGLTALLVVGGNGREVWFNAGIFEFGRSLDLDVPLHPRHNVLGALLAVIVPLSLAVTLSPLKKWIRWSAGVLTALFLMLLLLSSSGGGWAAAAAGIFLLLFLYRVRIFIWTAVVSAVIGIVTLPLWRGLDWASVGYTMVDIEGRIGRWQVTLEALRTNVFSGLGIGDWWYSIADTHLHLNTHNAYLQLYSDTGVLGLIAFLTGLFIAGRMILNMVRKGGNERLRILFMGVTAGIVAGGFHAVIDDTFSVVVALGEGWVYFVVPLFWIWLALFAVTYENHRVGHVN